MSNFALTAASQQTHQPPKHPHGIRTNFLSTREEFAEVRHLPRVYPAGAISRPSSEFNGSVRSSFDHATEIRFSYPQRDGFAHDKKKRKVDNDLIAASTTAIHDAVNKHRVPDDRDQEIHDRMRYEVIDNRFIPASTRHPDYMSIHATGKYRDCDQPLQRDNRNAYAMAPKPSRGERSVSFNRGKQPLLLWRPGDKQVLKVSNQCAFGSSTTVGAPYPRNCHQFENRNDVDNGYTSTVARPSFRPISGNNSHQRDVVTYGSKASPHLLWDPEDKQYLTELHCFVRQYCIYIFCATHRDVENPRKGRKMALKLGQVGIGCLHCKNSESKLKGSTYFPTSLSGIYNATMIIQQRHFPVCPHVSREAFCMYNQLKTLTARSASTKEYWISSAMKMGLYDTSSGVFFRSNDDASARSSVVPQQAARLTQESLVRLVEPSDKRFATEYAYFVMEQMTTCVFTESDRLGKRKCHKIGFPGMACRHCYGGNGSGRFFPLTLKTFSDVSKSIHVLRNHLIKCTKAPIGMAAKVSALSDRHIDEKLITPFGSQKTFFDLIWKRLHPELFIGSNDVQVTGSIPPPLPMPPPPSPSQGEAIFRESVRPNNTIHDYGTVNNIDLRQGVATSAAHSVSTPLPSLASPPMVHRGEVSSQRIARLLNDENHTNTDCTTRPSKEVCMIPKKRYLLSQRNIAHDAQQYYCQDQSRVSSYHSLPPPQQQVSYSESDVSIAMILANGFGKSDDDHREPSETNV